MGTNLKYIVLTPWVMNSLTKEVIVSQYTTNTLFYCKEIPQTCFYNYFELYENTAEKRGIWN